MKSSPEHLILENNRILSPLRFGQKIACTAVSPLKLSSKAEQKVTAFVGFGSDEVYPALRFVCTTVKLKPAVRQ